jgi:hypothetical protein
MFKMAELHIEGYRGEPVPNLFLRQELETSHVAVMLPGFGYTCDMPLFYYATNLLLDAGADVMHAEYAYSRRADFRDLPLDRQKEWLFADAEASYRVALAQRAYKKVTLVGKSIGTRAMGHVLTRLPLPDQVNAIWLTPLLNDSELREQMIRFERPSLVVIGSADSHFDHAFLDELREASGYEAAVVEGADHGLDIPSDVPASVQAMVGVFGGVQRFLARRS